MVELMIAIFVLAVVMSAVAAGLGTTLQSTRGSTNKVVSANVAQQEMDRVRSLKFDQIALGRTRYFQMVAGVSYRVTRDVSWQYDTATVGSTCDIASGSAGTAKLAYLRVTVTVDPPALQGMKSITASTLITPPVGSFDPTVGNALVKVLDRNAGPQQDVNVFLKDSGGTVRTEITGVDGCAIFPSIPADSYTAYVNTPSYVDRQGVTVTPVQNVSVSAGQTKSVQFDYDLATTLTIRLVGVNAAAAIPNGMPITIQNTHFAVNQVQTYNGSGTSSGAGTSTYSIPNVFPDTDGYKVWAGTCLDADQEGKSPTNVTYYPGFSRDPAIPTNQGGSSTGTVTLQTIRLRIRSAATGLPLPGSVVQAIHAPDPNGPGCPAGMTLPLGTTDVSGQVSVAIPYGTWTFKAGASTVNFAPGVTQITIAPPATDDPLDVTA